MEKFNVDPSPIFENFGLYEADLQDSSKRCHAYIEIALWHHAQNIIKEPCLGLSSGRDTWHPSQMGALGYAWLASATLERAFHRLSRFQHIVTNAYEVDIDMSESLYKVSIRYSKQNPAFQARSESILSTLLCMSRMNFGNTLEVQSVSFVHPAPDKLEKYRDVFNCEPEFAASMDSISFGLKDIRKNLPSANPIFAEMMDQSIIKTLSQLETDNIVSQVKSVIIEQLSCGKITEEDIAGLLNMSKRKLQLKLADENVRFKSILDEIRSTLARDYLNEQHLCLSEIAFLLGFSEVSSFSRAFKRWTGISPGQFKKS
ncbi:AraC family transcriptional regulator [sulfur-oxidizing endosymbiont of Gigantopelta aegis]|uniref:AraC family transcriptional regulator n=1 Tax=sulfur-oxidizing endosymbiont of Gigantopelta aegis TaxID=2794934 RepID=UPI0018DC4CE8|nr:AraC family transcriptional regulator [sulfur-oxidizing endosymbiont of Gigantopelta aegis]